MKTEFKKYVALFATALLVACGGDDGTGSEPGSGDDGTEESPASSTRVQRASLEAAVPANGEIVRGEFLLGALVNSGDPVEVRFLIDGVEVGVVNELPYQIGMSACDLTEGNHAYIVEIRDEDGNRDHKEQFFEAKACD